MVLRLKANAIEGRIRSQIVSDMADIIRRADKDGNTMEVEGATISRFGELNAEDQIRLSLFCRLHLFMLNPGKYPVRDEDIRPYIQMLKDRPYLWLLNLLQCVKSEQMSFIYRDILDSKIILSPTFHLETSDRYILPELVNAEALEISVDREKTLLTAIAHSPGCLLSNEDILYFKFNLMIYKMYEQCIDAADSG